MSKNQGINFLGRVVDQHKHAPISGAKISLNFPGTPSVVYSDLEGIYRFTAKFNGNSSLDGKLTIEAKGYQTYESFITLLPNKRDLLDIQLVNRDVETRRVETRTVESKTVENREIRPNNNSMLILILGTVVAALTLLVVVATKPSTQRIKPQETPQKIHKKNKKNHKFYNYVSNHLVS